MIQLENIGVTFPNGTRALRGVNLELSSDQFTAIIGPSGAGKSTLIRVLNGLVRPTEGRAWVDGFELGRARRTEIRNVRRSIAMVFQHANLVHRLNALENVLLGRMGYLPAWRTSLRRYPRSDRDLAYSLLGRVGMAGHAYQRADTLSGGEQQRVGIARALAQQPRLLLADEPIASLDLKSAALVMDHIRHIHQSEGIAVLVNLHNLGTVRDYADRVIGVRRGEIVFDGSPQSLTDTVVKELYYEEDQEGESIQSALSENEHKAEDPQLLVAR